MCELKQRVDRNLTLLKGGKLEFISFRTYYSLCYKSEFSDSRVRGEHVCRGIPPRFEILSNICKMYNVMISYICIL